MAWVAKINQRPAVSPQYQEADQHLGGQQGPNFDHIEWETIPDPATQSAALQRDEVDWVEAPLIDLTPMLRKAPGIKVEVFDKLGY